MKVTLISHTPAAEQLLIFAKSTRLAMSPALLEEINSMTEGDIAAELRYIANTIPSSWEFVDYVFLLEGVSRAFTHQFVRTRTGSYAQQSMRVVAMGEYDYVPTERNKSSMHAMEILAAHQRETRACYNALIAAGQPPEDARGILPTNISTNILAKFNLRTLSELVRSRSGGRTQDEYRRVASGMADAVLAWHPWAEEFLFPRERDYFAEIEAFAEREYGTDLKKKGELLKIVDAMRKSK